MARSAGLVRTATCRVTRGLCESTGETLTERQVAQRIRWLGALVAEIGQACVDAHWDRASVQAISAEHSPDGRKLPTKGFTAYGRLWGPAELPEGVTGASRVAHMGAELAARLLRSAAHRSTAVDTLLAGGLPSACGNPVTGRTYCRKLGRLLDQGHRLPTDLFALEPRSPRVPAIIDLSVTDDQFCQARAAGDEAGAHAAVDAELAAREDYRRRYRTARTKGTERPKQAPAPRAAGAVLMVRLRLPLVDRPARQADWAWHRLVVHVPPRYRTGTLTLPTLRVTAAGAVRADVPLTRPAVQRLLEPGESPSRVLAVDWGARRLLTGTVLAALAHDDGRREAASDGRPLYFQPNALQCRARRVGAQLRTLQGKISRYEQLLSRRQDAHLTAKLSTLQREADRLGARQRHLNDSVARLAGRWVVEQALATGCQAIAVEDLRLLEHRGMGRRNNERVSWALRGKTATAITEAAEEAGLTVIRVNPSGTSTHCPRCDTRLHHRAAPNGGEGPAWALCPRCGFSADRDHSAAEKIGQRALPTTHVRVRHRRRRSEPPNHRGHAAAAPPEHDKSGPGAGRPAVPPLVPAPRDAGHRSAGTSPRHETHQAGRQQMATSLAPPDHRLTRLLHAHRTTLRATGLREEPRRMAQRGTPGPQQPRDTARHRFEPRKACTKSPQPSTVHSMQIGRITRTGVLQAIAECDRLGREGFLTTYHFRPATTYVLLHEGREYDSKAIAGVAHRYDFGRALTPSQFSGGRKHAVDWLEREGSTVVKRTRRH
jgi:IS605 OrfB family transposase